MAIHKKQVNQGPARLAKVAGGAIIVVALIFLIGETRNTAEIDVRAVQEGIDSLDEVERQQYMTRRKSLWASYENAYFARQRGVLGDSEWARLNGLICQHYVLEPEAWEGITVRGGVRYSLTPEFRLYTENTCQ